MANIKKNDEFERNNARGYLLEKCESELKTYITVGLPTPDTKLYRNPSSTVKD
jgi:hypothetical protein